MEKDIKLVPLLVEPAKTKTGKTFFNVTYQIPNVDMEFKASTWSDTIAKALEERMGKGTQCKVKQDDYGQKIVEVEGIKQSGFKKGGGYQKDTVSIERQKSADIAVQILKLHDLSKSKDIGKQWQDLADKVYIWISSRPSEPQATGGATPQKQPPVEEFDPNDIPFKD